MSSDYELAMLPGGENYEALASDCGVSIVERLQEVHMASKVTAYVRSIDDWETVGGLDSTAVVLREFIATYIDVRYYASDYYKENKDTWFSSSNALFTMSQWYVGSSSFRKSKVWSG